MSSINYSGWVPMRRGIIEHLIQRRLTHTEAIALMVLIMLADKSTGSYTINVPTLRYFLPTLTVDAADCALRGLHTKRYIWRKVAHKSPVAYPYWVHGYEPTYGDLKGLRLDLTEVFVTRAISKLKYVSATDDRTDVRTDDGTDALADDRADSNEKREITIENQKETLPLGTVRSGTESALDTTPNALQGTTCSAREAATFGQCGAPQVRPSFPPATQQVPTSPPYSQYDVGFHWAGTDKGFRDSTTGKPVLFDEINKRVNPCGLEYRESQFFKTGTDAIVPFEDVKGMFKERSVA